MGMIVIESNTTLNLSKYGLVAGDTIDVICVGGGAGGAAAHGGTGYATVSDEYGIGGDAGNGGKKGRVNNTSRDKSPGGGGAGAGYGAGGGGAGALTINASNKCSGGHGGGAGEYKIKSHILNSTTVNSIAVTIGAAGKGGNNYYTSNSYYAGTNGGITSFGSILSAQGGKVLAVNPAGEASGGAGGQGGFLLPMRMYGGQGGVVSNTSYNITNVNTASLFPQTVVGLGGGGGAPEVYLPTSNISFSYQQSQYGGHGGDYGQDGGKGIMSKGEGVVVVLW